MILMFINRLKNLTRSEMSSYANLLIVPKRGKYELFRAHCSALNCTALLCSHNLAMYRKLRVSHNNIQRRLLGFQRFASARTLFVNKRHDNVDVLILKQCYNLKLRIEGSHNRVIKSNFDSCFFKSSKLFARLRDNIEVT